MVMFRGSSKWTGAARLLLLLAVLMSFGPASSIPVGPGLKKARLQPVPAAFVYTKELYTAKQNMVRNITNGTVVMNPKVYWRLARQIRKIKGAEKPLRIMVNSHPCAGKSFFLHNHKGNFMGCKLVDHDYVKQVKVKGARPRGRDSSYLMQDAVVSNTALLGSSLWSSQTEKYDDVIYIFVIPPLTIVKQNVKHRQMQGARKDRWSQFDDVLDRRRTALSFAIKEELLMEPLFATFEDGLKFCINAYDTHSFTHIATLLASATATAPDVILATFDGADKATTFNWVAKNDPVMGGSSTSSAGIINSTLEFSGTCAIVKYLKAPGFASVHTSAGQVFNRAGSAVNGSLNLMLRSSTPTYTGFKVGFSAKGIPIKPKYGHGDGSFKASFQLKNQTDWQQVNVPMRTFSDDWSPFTGGCGAKDPFWSGGQQHHCCGAGADVQYCPTTVFLSALTDLSIWAEGVAGDFQIEAKWIGATNA